MTDNNDNNLAFDFSKYIEEYNKKHDIFNNPFAKNAINSMTPEQKEQYRKIGEEMYGKIDYSNIKNDEPITDEIEEACAYIVEGLKSGLHYTYLEDDEKELMERVYGREWYKKWELQD